MLVSNRYYYYYYFTQQIEPRRPRVPQINIFPIYKKNKLSLPYKSCMNSSMIKYGEHHQEVNPVCYEENGFSPPPRVQPYRACTYWVL